MATRAERQLSIRTAAGVTLAGELTEGTGGVPGQSLADGGMSAGPLAASTMSAGPLAASAAGQAIVLLHGLTATRRYVVMGSRVLERAGLRVIAYDARGHGHSSPAPDPTAYGYEQLVADLLAVLDALELPRAILAGASMGAHTALALALRHPERVSALGIVTPAFDPLAPPAERLGTGQVRDPLAQGLREHGVEGFVSAYDFSAVPEPWRATVEKVIRQRLAAHEHPEAVADALEVVPYSRPFEDMSELAGIGVPTLVVASRDEVDPGHPLALAERYAQKIPGAVLKVEDGGPPVRSPIAWQGGQLSKLLVELAESVHVS